MDLGLADRTVAITGASGGIGRALAEVLGAEGARLVLLGNTQQPALEAWTAGQPWSDRAVCLQADLTQPSEVDAAFEQATRQVGRIDACVANAGAWPRPH